MSRAEERLSAAVMELVDENPAVALSLLTGHFVGLTLALLQSKGMVENRDIFLDATGSDGRDITIHAKKGAQS
jgi:hypothetical protein